jgi:hypothetical protein
MWAGQAFGWKLSDAKIISISFFALAYILFMEEFEME